MNGVFQIHFLTMHLAIKKIMEMRQNSGLFNKLPVDLSIRWFLSIFALRKLKKGSIVQRIERQFPKL